VTEARSTRCRQVLKDESLPVIDLFTSNGLVDLSVIIGSRNPRPHLRA
jgi:hypothetical protein